MRPTFFALLLLTSLAAPAFGDTGKPAVDLAFGAYQRGDYATALAEAKKRLAANPKDATAMTLIGRLYSEGAGVKRDRKLGLDWMRRAAEAGGAEAAYLYGAAVLLGAKIPRTAMWRAPISKKPPRSTIRRRSTCSAKSLSTMMG